MFGSPRRKWGRGGRERGEGSLLVGRRLACWIWGQNLPMDLSAQLSRVTPSPPATPKGVPAWNHMKLSQPFLDACTNPMNKNTWLRKAVSSTLFWWAGEILPLFHTMFFHPKTLRGWQEVPFAKGKWYKKLQKVTKNAPQLTIVATFSKQQTTPTPPRWSHFETAQNLGGTLRPPVITGRWSCYHWWEPWTLRDRDWFPGFRELSGKRYFFSCIFNFGPKNKNKHVKTMKETTRIFLQFLLGLSKFVKSCLVVRLKGFPTKNQEWTNHLENLLAFYLSVGWPTFCHWKRQAEMIHPWSVWASPKGYFLRKGDWKTILTTPYLLGLC